MDFIIEGIKESIFLIFSFDKEVYQVIFLSLYVSGISVLISTIISLPIGIITGISKFKGKKLFSRILFTFMGLPPVVVGLIVFLSIARRGPLGEFQLKFTPTAMIIAQTLLITPIIMGNIFNSFKNNGNEIMMSAKTLGANKLHTMWILIKELKPFILIAVVTGFGRAISEVGAVLLVGGNIEGKTRVMTTYISMNTSMGNYSKSIAMAIILILLAFIINSILYKFVIGESDD